MELKPEYFMQQALKLAQRAFEEGEVPIGAVVVADQHIIGKGYNQSEKLNDATAHAEILAITAASEYLGSKYLNECEIFVTVEPCLMCIGAIEHARLRGLYFGCSEPKHGFQMRQIQPKIKQINSGILELESRKLMQDFFVSRR